MPPERRSIRELFSARGHLAHEGTDPCVDELVLCQTCFPRELFVARLAPVWTHSRVDHVVTHQMVGKYEGGTADVANVSSFFCV